MADIKILIVAQNASSVFGGEAFIPLKYFQKLYHKGYKVKLIAHQRNKTNLEKVLTTETDSIYYVKDTKLHQLLWKIGSYLPWSLRRTVTSQLINSLNEFCQLRLAKQLIQDGEVDIVHQPIPVSPITPSLFYNLSVPIVIGPLNGGMTYPEGYDDYQHKLERVFIFCARKIGLILNYLIPGKLKATTLIVANERTKNALPTKNHSNVVTLVENGVDLSIWDPAKKPNINLDCHTFRLVFIGRLIKLKAIDITLDALNIAKQRGSNVTLDIVGNGEKLTELKEYSELIGINDSVKFHGFLDQQKCADILAGADGLILNSIHECGGAVVLEAMSMGLPVIASKWGGPPDYIDDSCGILVNPTPRETFSERLADAIIFLENNFDLRRQMGNAGRQKVIIEFDWDKKIDKILHIYTDAIDKFNYQTNIKRHN